MCKRPFNESVDLNKVMEMGSQHHNFRVAWVKKMKIKKRLFPPFIN